jgi:hypothetical protein
MLSLEEREELVWVRVGRWAESVAGSHLHRHTCTVWTLMARSSGC